VPGIAAQHRAQLLERAIRIGQLVAQDLGETEAQRHRLGLGHAPFEHALDELHEIGPALARGVQAIEGNLIKGIQLAKLTEADRDSILQHIHGTTDLAEIAKADLVIEAAPEKLELKQQLLRDVEKLASQPFIFASNTSSLSITELAKASDQPGQVVGMHFFNPVHIMRLIEIVVGKATSDDTVEAVRQVAQRLRKEPIVVQDVPGFASSRLGVALGLEAMRMVEQGVASAEAKLQASQVTALAAQYGLHACGTPGGTGV